MIATLGEDLVVEKGNNKARIESVESPQTRRDTDFYSLDVFQRVAESKKNGSNYGDGGNATPIEKDGENAHKDRMPNEGNRKEEIDERLGIESAKDTPPIVDDEDGSDDSDDSSIIDEEIFE